MNYRLNSRIETAKWLLPKLKFASKSNNNNLIKYRLDCAIDCLQSIVETSKQERESEGNKQ